METLPIKNNESEILDFENIEIARSEIKSISESLLRYLDQTQAITEIAMDRNFTVPEDVQKNAGAIIARFQPYGEYQKPLRDMIDALMSIGTMAYQSGLLIKQDELTSKLNEIKGRNQK